MKGLRAMLRSLFSVEDMRTVSQEREREMQERQQRVADRIARMQTLTGAELRAFRRGEEES